MKPGKTRPQCVLCGGRNKYLAPYPYTEGRGLWCEDCNGFTGTVRAGGLSFVIHKPPVASREAVLEAVGA